MNRNTFVLYIVVQIGFMASAYTFDFANSFVFSFFVVNVLFAKYARLQYLTKQHSESAKMLIPFYGLKFIPQLFTADSSRTV